VQHTIRSSKRAQTLDPNQRPENSHEPLNLTLDLEHAHVSCYSAPRAGMGERRQEGTFTPGLTVSFGAHLTHLKHPDMPSVAHQDLHGPVRM
jgi:hypothetical protein